MNPSFCSLLGFSEDELRNKHNVGFSPREELGFGVGSSYILTEIEINENPFSLDIP